MILAANYWNRLLFTCGIDGSPGWISLAFIGISALLLAWVPRQRRRVGVALLIFLVAVALLLGAGGLLMAGLSPDSATFRTLRFIGQVLVAIALISVAGVLLFDVLLRAIRLRPPAIVSDLVVAAAYLATFISLLAQAGVNLTGIVATSAVVTAVIGFSLQDTLGNLMGGLFVQLDRSITVGDWIRVGEVEGRVTQVRWRFTAVETRNGDTALIPNSVITKSQVTLLGRRDGQPLQRRQWVYFNVDFRHTPTQVIDAVEAVVASEPITGVAARPAPHCIMTGYEQSTARYAVRYWLTDMSANDGVDSIVRTRIFGALKRAGIDPAIPAHSVFLTEEDAQRKDRKRTQEEANRITALRGIELFAPLTDPELQELAGRLRPAPFVRGEKITRQGTRGDWLYILVRGRAEVRLESDDHQTWRTLATLAPGDFFGEMGLMTGGERTATVVALADVSCYRLDKASLESILSARPQIAEEIARILARRRTELEAARENLNEEALRHRLQREQQNLLVRIRRFFTLEQ